MGRWKKNVKAQKESDKKEAVKKSGIKMHPEHKHCPVNAEGQPLVGVKTQTLGKDEIEGFKPLIKE